MEKNLKYLRVAFVCSSGSHMAMFSPVIKKLRENDNCRTMVYSLDPFYKGINGDVGNVAIIHGLNEIIIPVSVDRPRGRAGIVRYLKTIAQMYWRGAGIVRAHLRELQPMAVVLGNDTGHIERAFIRFAKIMGVRTILVQDGFILPSAQRTEMKNMIFSRLKATVARSLSHKYGSGGCNIICAMSEFWSVIFSTTVDPKVSNIQIVGNTVVDAIAESKRTTLLDDAIEACARPGNVTFFCTNFLSGLNDRKSHELQLEEINLIHKFLMDRYGTKARLIVKLHPADDMAAYQTILNPVRGSLIVIKDADFNELIRQSWVCVTNFSSIILQCVVLGRVCLLSNLVCYNISLNWISEQFFEYKLNSVEQMDEILNSLISPVKYLEMLDAQHSKTGKYVKLGVKSSSADQIATLIETNAYINVLN